MILPEGGYLSADLLSRVEYFAETYCQQHERLYRYGWGHLLFACYAAFPAHLTPDLLHKLRLNFRHYALSKTADEGERSEIHPVAVNDLLLSNLVRETGFERYEMPEEIRHYLLWLLQHSDFFKKKGVSPIQTHEKRPREKAAVTRLNHLAAFLLRYTAEHYTASDPVTRSLREAQEWTAQAWLDPAQAARRIREKLSDESATPNERYHFSRLGNRLGAQYALQLNPAASNAPASFSVLHTYAQGIAALYSGKTTQARAHFGRLDNLRVTEGATVASDTGTLRLRVPNEVVKQLLIDRPDLTQPPPPDATERPREPKPLRWTDRETRLRSPHPKAVLTIADGDIKHILRALARMEKELREQLGGGPDFCLGDGYDVLVGSGKGAYLAAMLAARRQVADVASELHSKEGAYLREGTQMMGDDGYAELIAEHFKEKTLYDPLFLSGVVIANPQTEGKGFDFAHNLPDMDGTSGTNLIELHLLYAIAPPAGVSTLNSLHLEVTPLLLEAREKLRWPAAPDDLFWVSVDTTDDHPPAPSKKKSAAPAPVQVLSQHIQTDLRWLERHTFDLLGQHRLRYHDWDCSGKKEKGMEWPKGWYAVVEPPEVVPAEAVKDGAAPTPLDIYVVTANSLNLRAGPSTSRLRLGELKKGAWVNLMSTEDGWAQVRELEPEHELVVMEGWVGREFIAPLAKQPQSEREPLALADPFHDLMLLVQGGSFDMGDTLGNGSDEEKPVHRVTVPDFYLCKYPVTQRRWKQIMGDNPSRFKGDDLPVEQVSWEDIQVYIKKLNEKTGKNYRLPTEAEWEYAAKGGNQSKGYQYAGSNDLNEVGWYSENSGSKTHPVGQKKPNELSLYDMSGNVREWCEDDWHDDYKGAPNDGSAWINRPERHPLRAYRGGGCNYSAQDCRVSHRYGDMLAYGVYSLGFRLALSVELVG